MQQPDTIKILIADDHPILRRTLSNYLSQEGGFKIVGEIGNTGEVLAGIRLLQPDILLLDANMPGPDLNKVMETLKSQHPDVRVLVLTASRRREQVLNLLNTGVSGYILKEDSPGELLEAIQTIAAGKEWFSPQITRVLVSTFRDKPRVPNGLTEREKDVARLMVQGASNDEIAEQLFIATNTVKNHVRNIFRKLNVKTRVEAVLFVIQHHLLENEEQFQL